MELRAEFRAADRISRNRERLAPLVEAVVEHVEGVRRELDLPLDVQATAFERRVWAVLRTIP